MSPRRSLARPSVRRLTGFVLVLAVVVGCTMPGNGPGRTGAFTAMNIDSMPAETILALAARLPYDSSEGVSDTATITEGTRSAVLAFDPIADARQRSLEELQGGMFVARWRRVGDSVRYPMRSARGYVWMDSAGQSGWRIRFYSSDPTQGFSNGLAYGLEDSDRADSFPKPKAPIDIEPSDTIRVMHCYYVDLRLICPRFEGLTEMRVRSAYLKRPR